jgi:hypothetical protein
MIDDNVRIVSYNAYLGLSIIEQATLYLAVIINVAGRQAEDARIRRPFQIVALISSVLYSYTQKRKQGRCNELLECASRIHTTSFRRAEYLFYLIKFYIHSEFIPIATLQL